jgi:hypothetical protein
MAAQGNLDLGREPAETKAIILFRQNAVSDRFISAATA